MLIVEIVVLVVAVLIAGAVCGGVSYRLQNHKKNTFVFADFSGSSTYGKMLNSKDVAVDEIISDFKLLE
jgi:hypothetical protein